MNKEMIDCFVITNVTHW